MYISLFSLFFIGAFTIYYVWHSDKNSKRELEIINVILAISYIEKNIDTHKELKDQANRYAFLLQYLLDMHNLKVSELNEKWLAIYNFFQTRTGFAGSGIVIKYSDSGRLHSDVILHIADMYKNNSYAIGNGLWKDSLDCINDLGKNHMNKSDDYYPQSFSDLVNVVGVYDKEYLGHIMMDKRSSNI